MSCNNLKAMDARASDCIAKAWSQRPKLLPRLRSRPTNVPGLLIPSDAVTVACFLCLDGLVGMAVVGGAAAVAIGSIVGLGIALSRK